MPMNIGHRWFHAIFLCIFAVGLVCLWMLPMWIAGYPYELPGLLDARNFAETGLFAFRDALGRYPSVDALGEIGVMSPVDGRLSMMLFAMLSRWIPWDAILLWSGTGAVIMAASFLALWFLVLRVFDVRTAWVTVIIAGLMPLYFQEASYLHVFQPALLFLLLSFAAFVWLRGMSPWLTFGSAGILFGLSIASKDVFLIFLPWMVGVYVWEGWKQWCRSSRPFDRLTMTQRAGHTFLFLFCASVVYLAPYIGDIRQYGYPVNWNLAHFSPGGNAIADMTYEHMYPDPYTYYFDREWFDTSARERVAHLSTLEKLQEQKVLLAYDVVEPTLLRSLASGFWLFMNNIPPYLHQGTVGGAFLWIFIIVGMASLLRTHRRLFWWMMGLVVSTELVVRFILHYNRIHAMDTAWILAIFAAVGVGVIADRLADSGPRGPASACIARLVRLIPQSLFFIKRRGWLSRRMTIAFIITLLVAFQLLQTNRLDLAERYRRTFVPRTLAAGQAIRNLPGDAIVAVDRDPYPPSDLAFLGGRTIAPFTEETVRRLLENGRLTDAFKKYGVTHILEYPADIEREILRKMPGIKKVPAVEHFSHSAGLDRWIRYILHMVR